MGKELISRIGENKTGIVRLEYMNTVIENDSRGLSPDVSIKPLVELVRYFESNPNLAVPTLLTGKGMSVEDGQIYVDNPTVLKQIVEATVEPLSDELRKQSIELVILGVDRLLADLQKAKIFNPSFGSDILEELTVGKIATTMSNEQSKARKLVRKYITEPKNEKLALYNLEKFLKGEDAYVIERDPKLPKFFEPGIERVTKIKELCATAGFYEVVFGAMGSNLSIEFRKPYSTAGGDTDQNILRELFVEIAKDFCDYASWKRQKKVVPNMVDMDRLETLFNIDGANAGFAEFKRSFLGGLKLDITLSDYKSRDEKKGILHNPQMNIGIESVSIEEWIEFAYGFASRFGVEQSREDISGQIKFDVRSI